MQEYVCSHEGLGTLENGVAVFYALRQYENGAQVEQSVKQIRGFIRPVSGPSSLAAGITVVLSLSDGRKVQLRVESGDVRSATVVAVNGFF
jgi:hypothetical protein